MGSGNPPDKPGYKFLELGADFATNETSLNALVDQGYTVEKATTTYLLLANYKRTASPHEPPTEN